jgi:flagellar L-ring protein FlgH
VKRSAVLAALAIALGACSHDLIDVGEPPQLSPVGAGLPSQPPGEHLAAHPAFAAPQAGWQGGSADFFRDARAKRSGDVLTVRIAINDKAAFNNTSALSRKAQLDAGINTSGSFLGTEVPAVGATGGTTSASSASGQGSTVRSEKINLSVAAIVTAVLPNGYLVIEGRQEVMVNEEQRILHVAGIVYPGDILPDNTVSYERIAEARVSYGGQGAIADEQRPTRAQQFWRKLNLF